jgi:hypothetical protein
MSTSTQCLECRRYQGAWSCEAFPEMDSIPDDIATGEFDHTNPHEGDNGLRFVPEKQKSRAGRK